MKSLVVLLFGILVIFFLQSTATEVPPKSIANKDEYLKAINEERRQWAKYGNITNMNKLIWDDFLEKRTQMDDRSGYMKTMRYVRRDGGDYEKKIIDLQYNYFKEANLQELIKLYHESYVVGMEGLTPAQQRIGCSPQKGEVPLEDDASLNFNTLCFLEPEGLGDSWNVTRGPPGSACPKGYENEDGLCALVEKAETSEPVTDSKEVSTPASRPALLLSTAAPLITAAPFSTTPVESFSHGTCLLGVFLTMIMIYGMF